MANVLQQDALYLHRIAQLSRWQRDQLAGRLDALLGHELAGTDPGHSIACIKSRADAELGAEALRDFALQQLPAYMVPQLFWLVEDFPRLPSGKIDRNALTGHDWIFTDNEDIRESGHVAPVTDNEKSLAAIWEDVLGISDVSIHDNFYELGGDSLISIRILARANKAGLAIAPDDFFSFPTIAGQSALIQTAAPHIPNESPVVGEVGLTPIQHWFFERITVQPAHWNQSMLFRVDEQLDFRFLHEAMQCLLRLHDVLRSEFLLEAGQWRQIVREPEASSPVSYLDCTQLAEAELARTLEDAATGINSSFDLQQAPLIRLLFVETAAQQANRLLIVIHHLIVDAESWRIFMHDLEQAWSDLARGRSPAPTAAITSVQTWASRLRAYAGSEILERERHYWEAISGAGAASLPQDFFPPESANTHGTARTVGAALGEAETERLLRVVSKQYQMEAKDILATALLLTLAPWAGRQTVLFDMEGHGREALFEDLDVSRTMGWFTTVFPVLLETADAGGITATLLKARQRLREIPRRGLGYGVLRELGNQAQTRASLRSAPAPRLCFNYLGQIDRLHYGSDKIVLEQPFFGPARAAAGPRPYQLEINASIAAARLRVDFTFSDSLHRQATIAGLANDYIAILTEITGLEAEPELAPEDFPLADLDQDEMDRIASLLADVDDERGP